MDKYIVLEPMADILIESMRSIGYTFESAMADIIDNSISAHASCINICFDPSSCHLSFLDNGSGMTLEELKEAMRWGSKDPLKIRDEFDLGRFGLGLKSASLSQCRKLTVVSKKENVINGLCWDLDYVRDVNAWKVIHLTQKEINNLPNIEDLKSLTSGTCVMWDNFDKVEVTSTSNTLVSTIEDLLSYAIDYLSLIFHMYVSDGLDIIINGVKIQKIDPFLTKNSFTQLLKADPLTINDNEGNPHKIIVEPYVLPHFNSLSPDDKKMLLKNDNLKNRQGFYIYRNKRLIVWGTWFRMVGSNEAFKNARVKVHIPNSLDDIWSIDVKKASATIPYSIKKQLFYAVKDAISKSEKIYRHRAINVNKQMGYDCVWETIRENDKTSYKVNRELPIIEQFTKTLNDDQITLLDLILSDIENNLPKYDIFNQIANNNDKNDDNYESAKQRVLTFLRINKIVDKEQFDNLIKPLLRSEPYCGYENLYIDLEKELFKDE